VDSRVEGLARTVGEELLEPTKIYVKPIRQLMEKFTLLGAAHITGGGVLENVPRMLPDNCKAVMKQSAWPVPPVFEFLQKAGGLDRREMHRTFNHGLGMVLAVDSGQADAVLDLLLKKGHQAQLVGEIVSRKDGEEQAEVLV
jgi:phosphoribosylformylglycinamidine cyclo-ligase